MTLWACMLCQLDERLFDRFIDLREHLIRVHRVLPERMLGSVEQRQLCGADVVERRTIWRNGTTELVIMIEREDE